MKKISVIFMLIVLDPIALLAPYLYTLLVAWFDKSIQDSGSIEGLNDSCMESIAYFSTIVGITFTVGTLHNPCMQNIIISAKGKVGRDVFFSIPPKNNFV